MSRKPRTDPDKQPPKEEIAMPATLRRERPTVVLVMAILNLVFGTFATLGMLCSGTFIAITYFVKIPTPPGGAGVYSLRDMVERLQAAIPGFLPLAITSHVLGLILWLAVPISGIGLLSMRPWARWTCIVYSLISIPYHIIRAIFTIVYVNPVQLKYQQEILAQQSIKIPELSNTTVSIIASSLVPILVTAYAIALLIVMFLPSVSAAFAGRYHRPVIVDEDYYGDVEEADDRR
jgi:hypothetical protein